MEADVETSQTNPGSDALHRGSEVRQLRPRVHHPRYHGGEDHQDAISYFVNSYCEIPNDSRTQVFNDLSYI